MKIQPKIFVFLLALLAGLLAGCSTKEVTLSGDEQEPVLAFSEPKTDTLLTGMNANDYARFSQDFDQDMLKAMSETQFDVLKKDRDAKLGLYVARQVSSVIQTGDFYVVIYAAQFEKDPAVTMRVVFRMAEPHQVSGLWFDK